MTIHVHLDTSKDPPVTADPSHDHKHKGHHDLVWKPGKGQDFTFTSLKFDTHPNPFTEPKVHHDANKVTADDDNSGSTTLGEFPYTIVVSHEGKTYSSVKSSPQGVPSDLLIHNIPD